jgi:hypothetical protein
VIVRRRDYFSSRSVVASHFRSIAEIEGNDLCADVSRINPNVLPRRHVRGGRDAGGAEVPPGRERPGAGHPGLQRGTLGVPGDPPSRRGGDGVRDGSPGACDGSRISAGTPRKTENLET